MTVVPVLLDARPPYLGAGDGASSLLLLPTGDGTVLGELVERIAAVASHAPFVLPTFDPGPRYTEAVRREEPGLAGIVGPEIFRDPLARFDPSDTLLLVSPACYPVEGVDLAPLVDARVHDARMLRHLLAFETGALGTREFVQSGADGRLRRVQRYFEPVTWPFPAGIIASLVPVSCVLMAVQAPSTSLPELRAALSAQGVPSQDVTYHGRLVDLTDEVGALALAERRLLGLVDEVTGDAAPTGPVVLSQTVRLHPTARFVGPVVVAGGVCVEAEALVVGPALLGRGAHVDRGATVAQCLVTDGARVAAGTTVRHRVVTDAQAGQRQAEPGAAAATADGVTAEGAAAGGSSTPPQRRQAFGGTPATPPPPLRDGAYLAAKAAVEPVVAAVLLLLLAPLFAVVAVLVVLDSGLPVFYGDRREGRGGVPFRCWKFRSMRANAAEQQRALAGAQQLDGPQFKMDRDPRVTRVGRWLRRLNVDELPQLWNVVRGQMSFVGPRPSPFRENQICIPWRHGRLSVRPGITGLWQVCRHDRAAGDFHQWIHYDLLYVRHASLPVDVRIAVATLLTLVGRHPVRLERILPDARGHRPRYYPPDRRRVARPAVPTPATPNSLVPGVAGPRPTPVASTSTALGHVLPFARPTPARPGTAVPGRGRGTSPVRRVRKPERD